MSDNNTMLEIIETSVNERGNDIVQIKFADIVASIMNEAQFAIISGKTPREAIKKRPGKGGKTFSYVPHGYVTAVLNRAFGFDWTFEIVPNGRGDFYEYFPETEITLRKKPYTRPASCIVQGKLTIHIHNPANPAEILGTIVKMSTGEREDAGGMTMGSLIKAAESDALKKAASRLGVALDLYWQDAEADYLVDTPTLTNEQRAKAIEIHADNGPKACAEYLTQVLDKEITRGDLARILPELNE